MIRAVGVMPVLILLLSVLVVPPVNADSPINQEFSEVLELETRWKRVTSITIDRYLQYLDDKGVYDNLSQNSISSMKRELKSEFENSFSWSRVGNKFVAQVLSYCDSETLNDLSASLRSKNLSSKARESIARDYLTCGKEGINNSMSVIQEIIKDTGPSIRKIISKYRNN